MSPKIEQLKPFFDTLSLNELEELKILLSKNYFQTFEKKKINEISSDLQKNGYSNEFINDVINGLKKASVYEN